MTRSLDLLIALAIPLMLITGLTVWLNDQRHRLPAPLAWVARHAGRIWISGIVLITSLIVVRFVLSRT
jgi:hypothetical protein